MHRQHRTAIAGIAIALSVVTGTGVAAAVPPAAQRSQVVNDTCTVAGANGVRAAGEEWVADAAVQAALAEVGAVVDATFVPNGKSAPRSRLSRGLIGQVLDDRTRTVVVVIDPTLVERSALQSALATASRRSHERAGERATEVPVRVQAGCLPARDLIEADRVIAQRSWHPQARQATFETYLDAATSTIHATFWQQDQAVADALKQALGASVSIQFGRPTPLAGRLDDTEPHRGGAKISIFGGTNPNILGCTAGFTVDFSDGRRGSVTAGHCFKEDEGLSSGNQFYGVTEGKEFFPEFDMMRIDGLGFAFTNVIYTDPGLPTERTVTGSSQPFEGQTLCVSGQKTRAKCQLQVIDFTGRLCHPEGCTDALMRARRPGVVVARKGDSGGPVYTQGPNNTAVINGMIVGGTEILDGNDGAQMVLAETIGSIEVALGVRVATS